MGGLNVPDDFNPRCAAAVMPGVGGRGTGSLTAAPFVFL